MGSIFNKSGGYRRLYSFNFATIVHLGTISFVAQTPGSNMPTRRSSPTR